MHGEESSGSSIKSDRYYHSFHFPACECPNPRGNCRGGFPSPRKRKPPQAALAVSWSERIINTVGERMDSEWEHAFQNRRIGSILLTGRRIDGGRRECLNFRNSVFVCRSYCWAPSSS